MSLNLQDLMADTETACVILAFHKSSLPTPNSRKSYYFVSRDGMISRYADSIMTDTFEALAKKIPTLSRRHTDYKYAICPIFPLEVKATTEVSVTEFEED